MREISPAVNATVDEYLSLSLPTVRRLVENIRIEKADCKRRLPSSSLIDRSLVLQRKDRAPLLDQVAKLVDENLCGRSDMCIQFADLLALGLEYLGLPIRSVRGTAIYYQKRREIFRWQHAWVRIDDEVVDGNVDCLDENPCVPSSVSIAPYWGPILETPDDRRLRDDRLPPAEPDPDVTNLWWPDLRRWIDSEMPREGP